MRSTSLVAVCLAVAMVPLAAAHHDDDHENGGGSPPDQALFGLCTAWGANSNGREHGNAENAPPFQSLQNQAEEADQTVEEFCDEVPRPGP